MARKRYFNLDDVPHTKSIKHFQRWRKERRQKQKDFSFSVPHTDRVALEYLYSNKKDTTITWIGHSTFFIQSGGLNILTDPVWARRMGLDKRLTDPGIPLGQMPAIDVVVISHSHYDHLNFTTLRKLKGNPLYLVPEGLKQKMIKKGFPSVMELNWWSSHRIGDVEFTIVPAQHWTKRTIRDTNTSHWGGWLIDNAAFAKQANTEKQVIYFVGDTGYFRGFKEIGKRFSIDYALVPIGAYEPEWFMAPQHVNPEQAVQAFLDTQAKYFIPMHYGTFRLADDTPIEALERLDREWRRLGLGIDRLKKLKLGETITC
ncbi:MBL fold metallo-hydrolase [Fodinisporobacter ferrooxydans]|uniref:MBL fold metallo-hydrolase n=1 Tax=Fodinisporobacter ferrooxydans TaxID=2901836 RepID=A0ABY4CQ75_9BACL|nr:MBL fold metallo-hydrolase [Alicyclobacillaceae bacterium MYW30-H2]